MRKKQCAIRRIATSDEEVGDRCEPACSVRPTTTDVVVDNSPSQVINDDESVILQSQLEDGTVIVQPEPAAADEAEAYDGMQSGRASMSSAPGIYDTVKCTACGKKVNPYNGTMQVHPLLKVLVCQKCHKYYASGSFDVDDEGKENQCRWCGEGGMLICCDQCEHSYCRTCIKRNLGRTALQRIESLPDTTPWYCYSCDPTELKDLQEEANVVMKAVRDHFKLANRRSEKHKATIAKKSHPQSNVAQHQGTAQQAVSMMGLQLDLSSVPKVVPKVPLLPAQAQKLPVVNKSTVRSVSYGRPSSSSNDNLASAGQNPSAQKGSSTQVTEQWYKSNVKIENILADIESVDTQSIGIALNASVNQLQSMMRQYSRFLQDLAAAKSQQDKLQIVSRFKSAYRMHLFLRLGKIRNLIMEEEKHIMRKSSETNARKHVSQLHQRHSQPNANSEPVIDLTDDCPPLVEEMPVDKQIIHFQNDPTTAAPLVVTPSSSIVQQHIVQEQAAKVPATNSNEIVVVLSDDEDTLDSCDSVKSKSQKPAAIVELLEKRRQREKSRKTQQPRKITVTADSVKPNGTDNSTDAASTIESTSPTQTSVSESTAALEGSDNKASTSKVNAESDSGCSVSVKRPAETECNHDELDKLSDTECPSNSKKSKSDYDNVEGGTGSSETEAQDTTDTLAAKSPTPCVSTQAVAAL